MLAKLILNTNTKPKGRKNKTRNSLTLLVAPTGIEPVTAP